MVAQEDLRRTAAQVENCDGRKTILYPKHIAYNQTLHYFPQMIDLTMSQFLSDSLNAAQVWPD